MWFLPVGLCDCQRENEKAREGEKEGEGRMEKKRENKWEKRVVYVCCCVYSMSTVKTLCGTFECKHICVARCVRCVCGCLAVCDLYGCRNLFNIYLSG